MVFFTDRDLGNIFPQVLREAGLNIEKHSDHFDQATPDDLWLPEVARRGWFPITRNFRIRYQPNERDAVMRSGAGLFIVIGPERTHRELAENFVTVINKIDRFLNANRPPFIAKIYRPASELTRRGSRKSGRVELWYSFNEWRERVSGR